MGGPRGYLVVAARAAELDTEGVAGGVGGKRNLINGRGSVVGVQDAWLVRVRQVGWERGQGRQVGGIEHGEAVQGDGHVGDRYFGENLGSLHDLVGEVHDALHHHEARVGDDAPLCQHLRDPVPRI